MFSHIVYISHIHSRLIFAGKGGANPCVLLQPCLYSVTLMACSPANIRLLWKYRTATKLFTTVKICSPGHWPNVIKLFTAVIY